MVHVRNEALDELVASLQYRYEIRMCSYREDCTVAISTAVIGPPTPS